MDESIGIFFAFYRTFTSLNKTFLSRLEKEISCKGRGNKEMTPGNCYDGHELQTLILLPKSEILISGYLSAGTNG